LEEGNMSEGRIGKENVGRIAERIVANELEYYGFLVRDLNLEGVAANVDLLAVNKDGKAWLVQVKASSYDPNYPNHGWWFQYGYCKTDHLQDRNEPMFNRVASSFQASVVALVCVRSSYEYQCLLLPAQVAEDAAQINIDCSLRAKKLDGTDHKPAKVWFSLYDMNARTEEKRKGISREQGLVRPFLIDRSQKIDRSLDVVRKQLEEDQAHTSAVLNQVFAAQASSALAGSIRG
jgi:hypothetical protein